MGFKKTFKSWQDVFFPVNEHTCYEGSIIPSDIQAKAKNAHQDIVAQQNTLTTALRSMFALADKQPTYMMWIKNEEARYVFADHTLRHSLLNGVPLSEIYGKTDNEIIEGRSIQKSIIRKIEEITPEDLPNIDNFVSKHTRICNFTDLITESFRKPCKYVENVGGLCLIVWKYPLYRDKEYFGTVGYAIDMTHEKEEVMKKTILKERDKQAFKINGTDNYYLTDFSFPKIEVNGVV